MNKKRLITSVLVGLVGINTMVQAQTQRPKLVVGIVVDQLRTDYLDYLRSLFGDKGFKRLMDFGVFMRDVDFRQTVSDPAAATAVIFTGNWPAANGLPSAAVYNPVAKRALPALRDTTVIGNYTSDAYSPAAIRLSTIADEIMADGLGLSSIYSIAPDPQQAVVMTGHAGSGAAWIDEYSGKWASTSYYKNFPKPLSIKNQYSPLSKRIDTVIWKPSRPISVYPGLPPQKKYYSFSHTFSRSDRDLWRKFRRSAPVNTEVTDAAIDCIRNVGIGSGGGIDMINVGYTAAPWKDARDGDSRVELADTYLRLDDQLGRLLDEIDRTIGLDNALIWLSSTGYYDDAVQPRDSYRIPGGSFSLKRAEGLLNSYLTARHGNADYVEAIHGSQVYLDHRAIESKGLDISDVRREAREFLLKMSGLNTAYTLDEVLSAALPETEALRLGIDPKHCGDIFLGFFPGWSVVDDTSYPVNTWTVSQGRVLAPAFIMAPDVAPREISSPVDATALAPTITSTLHIRSPNGAAHRPLSLERK